MFVYLGDIRKELPAVRANQSVLPVLQYHVTLETDQSQASGDSDQLPDVFIRLFGERGDSGSRHLNKLDADVMQQVFTPQAGAHCFVIEAVDLLDVSKVLVTKGRGLPLPVKCVKVKNAEFAPVEWIFQHDRCPSRQSLHTSHSSCTYFSKFCQSLQRALMVQLQFLLSTFHH